ncbi:DUF2283 domain-containing protein [Bacteroidota bacterium]
MKVKYDRESDVIYFELSGDVIIESDEDKQGIIIDYSAKGEVVGIEILNASKRFDSPTKLEYEVA